jgi:hypothetical protein
MSDENEDTKIVVHGPNGPMETIEVPSRSVINWEILERIRERPEARARLLAGLVGLTSELEALSATEDGPPLMALESHRAMISFLQEVS